MIQNKRWKSVQNSTKTRPVAFARSKELMKHVSPTLEDFECLQGEGNYSKEQITVNHETFAEIMTNS